MKKLLSIAAIALAAICLLSCQKTPSEKETPSNDTHEGGLVTLTATIDIPTPDSKTTYEWEDATGILKCSWSGEEKLSVLTLDASGKALTNDIFTAQSASGHTANFTGTFTGDPSNTIIVHYPALTEEDENKYLYNGTYATYDMGKTSTFGNYSFSRGQGINVGYNSLDGFDEYDAMKGNAVIRDGKLEVSLKKMISVIRLELDASELEDGITVKTVFAQSGLVNSPFHRGDWTYNKNLDLAGGNSDYRTIVSINSALPSDKKVVVYIPNAHRTNFRDGIVSLGISTSTGAEYYTKTVQFGEDKILEPGYVYRLHGKLQKNETRWINNEEGSMLFFGGSSSWTSDFLTYETLDSYNAGTLSWKANTTGASRSVTKVIKGFSYTFTQFDENDVKNNIQGGWLLYSKRFNPNGTAPGDKGRTDAHQQGVTFGDARLPETLTDAKGVEHSNIVGISGLYGNAVLDAAIDIDYTAQKVRLGLFLDRRKAQIAADGKYVAFLPELAAKNMSWAGYNFAPGAGVFSDTNYEWLWFDAEYSYPDRPYRFRYVFSPTGQLTSKGNHGICGISCVAATSEDPSTIAGAYDVIYQANYNSSNERGLYFDLPI